MNESFESGSVSADVVKIDTSLALKMILTSQELSTLSNKDLFGRLKEGAKSKHGWWRPSLDQMKVYKKAVLTEIMERLYSSEPVGVARLILECGSCKETLLGDFNSLLYCDNETFEQLDKLMEAFSTLLDEVVKGEGGEIAKKVERVLGE